MAKNIYMYNSFDVLHLLKSNVPKLDWNHVASVYRKMDLCRNRKDALCPGGFALPGGTLCTAIHNTIVGVRGGGQGGALAPLDVNFTHTNS